MTDFYNVLGIDSKADIDAIKKAYRNLAKQYHPDGSDEDNAEERMKEINEAYDTLGDPEKRRKYDYEQSNPGGGFGGFNPFGGFNMGDLFNMSRQPRRVQNSDIHLRYTLTLEQTIAPVETDIQYVKTAYCDACNGKGGHEPTACTGCGGSGVKTTFQQFGGMTMQQQTACNECRGKGTVFAKQCGKCHGFGMTREEVTRHISFPVGAPYNIFAFDDGGNQEHKDAPAGRLLLEVTVQPNTLYNIEGRNCVTPLIIDPVESILGGEYTVKSFDGQEVTVQIPRGVKEGHREVIKGLGIPYNNSQRGDMAVELVYEIPTNLSSEQEEILREYLRSKKEVVFA